jgi:L-lactate utilization protein LutC
VTSPDLTRETGDRAAFVGRLRDRLAHGVPVNVAHPMPPGPAAVPDIVHRLLDGRDLADLFEQTATAVQATVHRVPGADVPAELLGRLVDEHAVRTAVTTREPEALAVAETLADLGVTVEPYSVAAAARSQLGVTSAVAAIAATGSVALDSTVAGGRTAGLLPPVHLCVLPADRLVPAPSDVLRPLGDRAPADLPANLVLVTGPSRTGDIEQILTLGVHGPVAVHVVLLEA